MIFAMNLEGIGKSKKKEKPFVHRPASFFFALPFGVPFFPAKLLFWNETVRFTLDKRERKFAIIIIF